MNINGIEEIVNPQDDYTFKTMKGFTTKGLISLGCDVQPCTEKNLGQPHPKLGKDGKELNRYAFGPNFGKKRTKESNWNPERLQTDFNLYQVESYTTAKYKDESGWHSITRTATEEYPIFVFLYEHPVKDGASKTWGIIYHPEWVADEMLRDPYLYFYNGGLTPYTVNTPLLGDTVSVRVFQGSTVPDAVNACKTGEVYLKTRKKSVQSEDGSTEDEESNLDPKDIKVNNFLLCHDPVSAINAYYRLNSLSKTYDYGHFKDMFFHVGWMVESNFTPFMENLSSRLAITKYLMFNIDNAGKNTAFRISKRFKSFRAAFLPESLKECPGTYHGSMYRTCIGIRDFFERFEMTEEEEYVYDNDLAHYFLQCITAAIPIEPLVRCDQFDKKTKKSIGYYYKLDSSCIWRFMASEGYCREVDHQSADTIGRFLHVNHCFVKELDIKSLLAATISTLNKFAMRIAQPGTEDYHKMNNAIIDAKQIVERSAVNLPEMDIDYRSGYGPELDHIYYRNGVLRITPTNIEFISYKELNFCVDMAEILPFDFDMPCSYENRPFIIIENPEYKKRMEELDARRLDTKHYSQRQIEMEERELSLWSQRNRWLFDFRGKKYSDWWKPLKVLRGFANENFEREAELERNGDKLSEEEERDVWGRFANIIYSLGRPIFRYRGGGTNFAPYITENGVSKEGRSEGGSGKSTFVNVFMACAGHMYKVDARNVNPNSDIMLKLANYVPRGHRFVHWEDFPQTIKLDPLYNFITSGFEYRNFHHASIRVSINDSPGHVVTSNFQPSYEDPSSSGRIVPTGFSHRFSRGDIRKNTPPRRISDIMPGLRDEPQDMDIKLRSQIGYIDALAIQFCMKTKDRVLPPMDDLNKRSRVVAMGQKFMDWAEDFFSKEHHFLCPIDFNTIWQEYVELCGTSEDKKTKFASSAFFNKIKEYCEDMGFVVNPEICFNSTTDKQKGYMRVKAWCKEVYFGEDVWKNMEKKEIRVLKQSSKCLFFCKTDQLPSDYAVVKKLCNDYYSKPDPDPILDPITGEPVALTEEEQQQWDAYTRRLQGRMGYSSSVPVVAADKPQPGEVEPDKNLPF